MLTAALVVNLLVMPVVDRAQAAHPSGGWTKYPGDLTMPGAGVVVDTWVVKDGATYKMWYTHVEFTEGALALIDRVLNLDPFSFAQDFFTGDYDAMWSRMGALNAADLMAIFDGVTTSIGYATSTDGIAWTVEPEALSGGSSAFTAVGMPTVITPGLTDSYEMWYTQVSSDLDVAGLATMMADTELHTAMMSSVGIRCAAGWRVGSSLGSRHMRSDA